MADMPWRPGSEEFGRVPPRVCVQNARDALNQAYVYADPRRAMPFMISALDWQRRALEQMAGESPVPVLDKDRDPANEAGLRDPGGYRDVDGRWHDA